MIDHLTDSHVADQEIPMLEDGTIRAVAATMQKAAHLRESARLELHEHIERFASALPQLKRRSPPRQGWTVRATKLSGRLDAAFYDPLVGTARRQLGKLDSVRVGDVAKVIVLGRYKRLYSDINNGRPIISGAQLLQSKPIHLQHISPASFDDVGEFELRAGWLCYPCDGRAEEALGTPVIITRDRDRWLASNMIGRIVPHEGVDVGWLFLALKSPHAQLQFKATSSGSVIDHTYPADMESVLIPRVPCDGVRVLKLWDDLAEAQLLEDGAADAVDRALAEHAHPAKLDPAKPGRPPGSKALR